jgi:hypothetical protein
MYADAIDIQCSITRDWQRAAVLNTMVNTMDVSLKLLNSQCHTTCYVLKVAD